MTVVCCVKYRKVKYRSEVDISWVTEQSLLWLALFGIGGSPDVTVRLRKWQALGSVGSPTLSFLITSIYVINISWSGFKRFMSIESFPSSSMRIPPPWWSRMSCRCKSWGNRVLPIKYPNFKTSRVSRWQKKWTPASKMWKHFFLRMYWKVQTGGHFWRKTSSQSSVDAIDSWIANSWIAQFTNTPSK